MPALKLPSGIRARDAVGNDPAALAGMLGGPARCAGGMGSDLEHAQQRATTPSPSFNEVGVREASRRQRPGEFSLPLNALVGRPVRVAGATLEYFAFFSDFSIRCVVLMERLDTAAWPGQTRIVGAFSRKPVGRHVRFRGGATERGSCHRKFDLRSPPGGKPSTGITRNSTQNDG